MKVIAIELQTPLEAPCAIFSKKFQLPCDHGRSYPVIVGQFGEADAFAVCEPRAPRAVRPTRGPLPPEIGGFVRAASAAPGHSRTSRRDQGRLVISARSSSPFQAGRALLDIRICPTKTRQGTWHHTYGRRRKGPKSHAACSTPNESGAAPAAQLPLTRTASSASSNTCPAWSGSDRSPI